ncbi:MAG TPA: NUDIX domain-containing protein [Candidatus Saccharimonadales bacterium]|nr:NUDIX domain-containing protein [Candidatus Saccharimonadales bacterium]
MINRPTVGLGVFIWKDGRFLMFRRLNAHGHDTWSIPGGHLEYGESWEEGAKREALEETGLVVDNIRPIAYTNDIFPEHHKHSVTVWVYSDWVSGEAANMEPEKSDKLEWYTFKDLPAPLFEPCWQNLRKAKPGLFE